MASKELIIKKGSGKSRPPNKFLRKKVTALAKKQLEAAGSLQRAQARPQSFSANDVLTLQQTVGNKDVVQLLANISQGQRGLGQTKPTIQKVNGNGDGPPKAPPPPMPKDYKRWIDKKPEERAEKTRQEQLEELGLSQGEIGALQLYTTSMYKLANDYLRGQLEDEKNQDKKHEIGRLMEGTGVQDPSLNKLISDAGGVYSVGQQAQWMKVFDRFLQLIVSAIQKLPAPKTSEVSRGVNLDSRPEFFEKHKQNNVITDPGFMSTAFGTPFAKDSIVVIHLPQGHPGRDISQLSAYEKEAEIIFPPGSGYKIDRILTKKENEAEFNAKLGELVEDQEELATRFHVVERIYLTSLTVPT
jgi:hypothetical protein